MTTPTVSTPSSLAARAITGAAPVPVPPPMPAVIKTMCDLRNIAGGGVADEVCEPSGSVRPSALDAAGQTP